MNGQMVLDVTGTAPPKKHQVFVSFRGRDVRHTIFSFLKDALIKSGVNVVTDEDAPRGKPIDENLLKLIRDSRIAVVIFSENYSESTWCLDELVEIEKQMNLKMLDTCPIFFEVETGDVKLQAGRQSTFEYNLLRLEHGEREKARQISKKAWEDAEERFRGWRRALISVSSRLGLTHKKGSTQAPFVNDIVEKVKAMLENVSSSSVRNPVQSSNVRDVKSSVLAGTVSPGAGHSSEVRRELMRLMPNSTKENRYDQYGGRYHDGFVQSESDRQMLLIKQQDEELNKLSKSLQRIGGVGITIHDDLVAQERIIDELDTEVDSTNYMLEFVQKKVGMVMKKAGAKGQIMMICFLLVLFTILFFLVFLT